MHEQLIDKDSTPIEQKSIIDLVPSSYFGLRWMWPKTEWETGPAQKPRANGKEMESGSRPEMAEQWPPKWNFHFPKIFAPAVAHSEYGHFHRKFGPWRLFIFLRPLDILVKTLQSLLLFSLTSPMFQGLLQQLHITIAARKPQLEDNSNSERCAIFDCQIVHRQGAKRKSLTRFLDLEDSEVILPHSPQDKACRSYDWPQSWIPGSFSTFMW